MLVKWSEQETELGVIGRVGENNTRKIEIDCAETLEKLPGAEIICVMLRPGDETPYTMPLEANGNKRTIVLTDTDLERRGTIRLEMRAVKGGAVLKSAILRGTVADSIRGEGDAPGQPVRDVLDRVDDALKAAEETRKELETALGGVQGAVDAATGAAGAATSAATAAEETDAQIQAAEQGRVAAEKQRQQATAAAVQSITDTVTDVQNKLESGAFNGAPGKDGEPGADGAPGKDGKDGLDAPQIDDTTVSDAAPWSSQHIVDMLCPPLEESGNPVVCYPVAGSTLGVTASWEPTQDGTGTPSPDNIRPIHGRDSVSITRQEDELSMTLTLQSTIYGGEVKTEGEGQETWRLLTLNGAENWETWGVNANNSAVTGFYTYDINDYDSDNVKGICSNLSSSGDDTWGGRNEGIGFATAGASRYLMYCIPTAILADTSDNSAAIAALKAFLAAQYAAGTPVQIAYKLATPVPFTVTGGGTIKALSGTNTILTDADTLTVTGRADPIHIIQQLQAASTASAQAIADVERAVTDI